MNDISNQQLLTVTLEGGQDSVASLEEMIDLPTTNEPP